MDISASKTCSCPGQSSKTQTGHFSSMNSLCQWIGMIKNLRYRSFDEKLEKPYQNTALDTSKPARRLSITSSEQHSSSMSSSPRSPDAPVDDVVQAEALSGADDDAGLFPRATPSSSSSSSRKQNGACDSAGSGGSSGGKLVLALWPWMRRASAS